MQTYTQQGFDFRFNPSACASCGGKCCVGESGYIFLSIAEAESIAAFLEMDFSAFAMKYMKKVGYRFSLLEKPYENGYACVFFDTEQKCCQIYVHRPVQCARFPFWEVFFDKHAQRELCTLCPGVESIKKS